MSVNEIIIRTNNKSNCCKVIVDKIINCTGNYLICTKCGKSLMEKELNE